MGEKLIVGPNISKGLKTDRLPFGIDNDSFPMLVNAYQWRGRVKRKRGTQLLGQLSRFLGTTDGSGNLTVTIAPQPIGTGISHIVVGTDIFTDQGGSSPVTMIKNSSGSGVLNRTSGVLTITGSQINTAVIYYPGLPVMGLEDFVITSNLFPFTLAFDTTYSYNITTSFPYPIYDVSFYKNPASGNPSSVPGLSPIVSYIQKTNWTPVSWNGENYQQFYTVNYQGALWVTNGIDEPFTGANIGMQFQKTSDGSTGSGQVITFTLGANPLIIGDFVFANEFTGTGPNAAANAATLNFQTGYVTGIDSGLGTVTVTFPNATITADTYSNGMLQFLTNRSDKTKDCIRWYDGDPTNGSTTSPSFVTGKGWVNFMPPLSQGSYSISENPQAQYYLVGARMIVPFKDRLLFLGPVIQTSSGNPIYLQDTIVYSQNGTPYYTASWTSSVFNPSTTAPVFSGFLPLLVPSNQTATPYSFWSDQTGFGGFIQAGIDQPMNTVASNEDALIVGFNTLQTKVIYSGNDIIPFSFYIINAELGSSSTFSTITMDQGVITRGSRGYVITGQTSSQRIDIEIPDQVFEIDLLNNGEQRFCAARDFINEWIYFTYPSNQTDNTFPDTTLFYNYRDNSWAVFNESYTTYGSFRRQTGFIWQTVGNIYLTWNAWNDPWDAGESTLLQPQVIGGNQQGFVLIKGVGTGEGTSLNIQNIVNSTVTSPNHNLQNGQYILITGCLGDVAAQVNGEIFSIANVTTNTFDLVPNLTSASYNGGGFITILYVPFIQTKQFPTAWGLGRKTRIGTQQYLLTSTANSQITLLMYLSQDDATAYNYPEFPNAQKIVPQLNCQNNSLIYSSILYTCPESTNLGLTPNNSNMLNQANTNLQMIVNPSTGVTGQQQIWHRVNTSLIGDTVQLGFTLSDAQMREVDVDGPSYTITGATTATNCVLTCTSNLQVGQIVFIQNVVGMTQLNNNYYQVTAVTSTQVTLDVNSTAFTPYVSGGTITAYANQQFAEIELHGFVLDITPSQVLA